MGLTNDDDPYTGELYLDRDSRTGRRVIRVVGKSKLPGLYKAQVIEHLYNPAAVGRRVRISAKTLDERYQKVSH